MSSRPLEPPELALIGRLLSSEFPGRNELLTQVQNATVVPIDSNGSLRFIVDSSVKAGVTKRIPVEAQRLDSDGIWIRALLHVVDGQISELEIYKDDSSPLVSDIDGNDWEILTMD